MAKLETILSVMTWGVMNALLLVVAFDSSTPVDGAVIAPAMHIAGHTAAA